MIMQRIGYPEFGALLNKTGRSMVYSCSWYDYFLFTRITFQLFRFNDFNEMLLKL